MRKLQEEQSINEINNLQTVAEQKELTKDKLQDIVKTRKEFLSELVQQTKIPTDALITGAIITAPVLLCPFALNYMCFAGLMTESIPTLAILMAKYNAINICFGAGIHWGFAMSMHEMQFDSVKSSPEAKKQFMLSTVPIFGSLQVLNTMCYTPNVLPEIQVASVGLLSLLYMYNLFMDWRVVQQQNAPKWFFSLKMALTSSCLVGLAGYAFIYHQYPELAKQKDDDPFRKHIPNKQELLSSSLKLSENKQKQETSQTQNSK